jgi:hypothetical protein
MDRDVVHLGVDTHLIPPGSESVVPERWEGGVLFTVTVAAPDFVASARAIATT